MKSIYFLFLLLCNIKIYSQNLSAEERKIVNEINKQMPQTLQLLEQSVNINSGTLNIEGVKKVGLILKKEFDKIGFTTEWITLPDSLKRSGHLVANIKGKKGKKLFSNRSS